MPARYMARIADGVLADALATSGAVQVKGPKWCGKTATSLQQAASVVYLQDPDRSASYLALADAKPSALLEGRTPRLIDEWQMAPQLWDAVRFAADLRGEPGQFVLTGSSTPTVGGAHSGVGRIAPMVMRTMTLFESEESSGRISLQRLFDGEEEVADIAPLDIEDIARILCRGGWPAAVTAGAASVPGRLARTYVEGLIGSDVARMDGVSRNSTRMRALMRAYARHVSTQASQTMIAADLAVNDGAMAPNTVSDYLDALSRAYVVEDLPAWNPALRSKTAIRTSPTRHFVDPSQSCAGRPPTCSATSRPSDCSSNRCACAICGSTPRRSTGPSSTTGTRPGWRRTPSSSSRMGGGLRSRSNSAAVSSMRPRLT